MQKVFPVEAIGANKAFLGIGGQFLGFNSKSGIVEEIVGPGKYNVMMLDGQLITAQGSKGLKVGSKVQVLRRLDVLKEGKDLLETQRSLSKEPGLQLQAFFPLGFGGKKARAVLRVYIERKNEE